MHSIKKTFEAIGLESKENLYNLIDSNSWDIYRGRYVTAVEQEFSKLLAQPVLTTNSGTSALELALRALGIHHGDEVIVPSFTYIATVQAVLLVGATPVLARVDRLNLNLSIDGLDSHLSKRTKAIIFVHTCGNSDGIDLIVNFCRMHNLFLVEDCAQALGAIENERQAGTHGDAAAFSFNTSKQVTCGDGGLFTSPNEEIYASAKAIRHAGLSYAEDGYISQSVGGKSLMTEFQAAVLLPQILRFKEILAYRRFVAEMVVSRSIKKLDRLHLQSVSSSAKPAWQRVVFIHDSPEQAISALKGATWHGRFYPRPLTDEPIVQMRSIISAEITSHCEQTWSLVSGFTIRPLVEYDQSNLPED
ncbi:aminotransferase class I/II-fold pyridoxal phosphate-dependent enzyme [Xanthomonas campestris pv. ionidii]|nr:aminotransferase class I/II-fold pyridoxal phosphate-dependent enzyme [Xanthomonas campestris pv. ionidii]